MNKNQLEDLRQKAEVEFTELNKEREQLEARHPKILERLTELKARFALLTEQLDSLAPAKSPGKGDADTIDATEVDKDAAK